MNLADIVKNVAPAIAIALGGPAAGAAVKFLGDKFLGNPNASEEEITNAIAQATPADLIKLKELDQQFLLEQVKLKVQSEQNNLQADSQQLETVNQTIRAEYASNDNFTRRWRPTWGYVMAFTWAVTFLGITFSILYSVIKAPQHASIIINAIAAYISSMSLLWGIALTVLGVNIQARTKDKQTAAGYSPTSTLDKITSIITKK